MNPGLERSGLLYHTDALQQAARTLRPGRRRGAGVSHQPVGVELFGKLAKRHVDLARCALGAAPHRLRRATGAFLAADRGLLIVDDTVTVGTSWTLPTVKPSAEKAASI